MKKIICVFAAVFALNMVFTPVLYAAPSWWNPLSWFESENENGPVWYNPVSWTREGSHSSSSSKPVEKKIHRDNSKKKIEKKTTTQKKK